MAKETRQALVTSGAITSVPVVNLKRTEDGKLQLPLTDLPSPPRQYVADHANFVKEKTGNRYRCQFWQAAPNESTLSAVEVVMSPDAVAKFINALPNFAESIQEKLEKRGASTEQLRSPDVYSRENFALLKSNAIRAASAALESTWDFYDVTPLSLSFERAQRFLPVEAVLRVELTSPLALALIGEMLKFRSELPNDPE